MKKLNKHPLILVYLTVLSLLAGCSRKIENSVSPPIDSSTIPPTPSNLSAETGDGFVVLSWSISDTSLVSSYNIYRADSFGTNYLYIGNSQTRSYTADDLQNSVLYYFRISSLNSDGFEGYKSDPVFAVPGLYSVLINNGAEYTNSHHVTLSFTAPIGTKLMEICSDSSFSDSQWETFAENRNYILETGDGIKTVYCRFRDAADRITWGYYSDSITLDSEAFIDSVKFSPSGPLSPGDVVHFAIYPNEAGGDARIFVGTDIAEIDLFDNGQRGDGVADDGVYERDYTIPDPFDFEDESVYGEFTDRAGNNASITQAASRLSVRRPPDAVNIFSINVPQGYHDRLNLNWEESGARDFAQYRVYRATSSGVDSTDFLVASIFSAGQTSVSDTGLTESTMYYYKVYVVDITGLWSGSNEVSATTGVNSPPEAVSLYPVIAVPDYYQQIEIEWSQSPDIDFESYRLYRWREDIGRDDSVLAAFVTSRQNTTFTDYPPFVMSPDSADTANFWYILHVFDNSYNSAPSDSVRVHLIDAVPPTVSGSVTSADSSLIITWSQSSIPDFGSYRLLRDVDSNPSGALIVFASANVTTISYNDDSASEGQTYYYWLDIYDLRANNSRTILGSGAW